MPWLVDLQYSRLKTRDYLVDGKGWGLIPIRMFRTIYVGNTKYDPIKVLRIIPM